MPARHGVGFHNNERVGPTAPEAAQSHPEEAVTVAQTRSGPFLLEHRELLTKRSVLDRKLKSRTGRVLAHHGFAALC